MECERVSAPVRQACVQLTEHMFARSDDRNMRQVLTNHTHKRAEHFVDFTVRVQLELSIRRGGGRRLSICFPRGRHQPCTDPVQHTNSTSDESAFVSREHTKLGRRKL